MSDWFENTSVKLITSADFDDLTPWELREKRCAFVLFFADWCGHCMNLKPEYIKFADAAQFIKIYALDSDKNETLLEKFNSPKSPVKISGFPTIWLYSNGKPYKQYNGDRSWQDLLKQAMKLCKANCKCVK